MKYVDEYRSGDAARQLQRQLAATVTRPWSIMEVCGGQTHAVLRFGLDQLFPPGLSLIHGPGCPVCVTPLELIDRALEIARTPGVILCSFGDMLRVPGTKNDLLAVRGQGGDVRIVYSPLDALTVARENPEHEVVFFAVGFETTAPTTALTVFRAHEEQLHNFSLLVSHVLVPPAMKAILSSESNRVQGFLAAGHVCTIMGCEEYHPLAQRFRVPIVVTGFEPLDLLHGILMCVSQLEEGRFEVENQYSRSVRAEGNLRARQIIEEVFEISDRKWRGIGEIPRSGLQLRERYRRYDASLRFEISDIETAEPPECLSGKVLQGLLRPTECPCFGGSCTPEHPLGATMVSPEGACAAYYRYRRQEGDSDVQRAKGI